MNPNGILIVHNGEGKLVFWQNGLLGHGPPPELAFRGAIGRGSKPVVDWRLSEGVGKEPKVSYVAAAQVFAGFGS